MWWIYALLAALFAGLTSVLAKIGIVGVPSHLATAIRTAVVLLLSWGMVFLTGQGQALGEIGKKSWLFLILSGLATGISWLCFYKALQMGEASRVIVLDKLSTVFALLMAFLFLQEQFTVKSLIGVILLTAGTLFMVL